jgi:hypothetical protein
VPKLRGHLTRYHGVFAPASAFRAKVIPQGRAQSGCRGIGLTLQVSMLRKSLGNVVFGDADNDVLRRRIRAFGNFVEYAPLCLLLLALVELQGACSKMKPSSWRIGDRWPLRQVPGEALDDSLEFLSD